MWMVYVFIAYMVLAVTLPVAFALTPVWLRSRRPRQVTCPQAGGLATIALDPWSAARMRVVGGTDYRVRVCSRWPDRAGCGQECVGQVEE